MLGVLDGLIEDEGKKEGSWWDGMLESEGLADGMSDKTLLGAEG